MFGSAGISQRYSYKCKIGNWSEDQQLEALKLKEFLDKKAKGQLTITAYQQRLKHCLQSVNLTNSQDGFIHFGDQILCYNAKTTGILSIDVSEKVPGHQEAYAVSTSTLIKGPVARNVFIVEPVDASAKIGDALKYGQHFRLRANSSLIDHPIYLASQPVSPFCFSKASRHCEVVMSTDKSYDSVWNVQAQDPAFRLELEGTPVSAHSEFVLIHNNTRQSLCSEASIQNDYGAEYEVCGFTSFAPERPHVLYAEAKGSIVPDVSVRHENVCNHWAFLCGSPESAAAASS